MRRCIHAALGLSGLVLLAACASPEPTYYTLAPVPGPQVAVAVSTVELRHVGLAGYLDRSDIVRRDSGYRLEIANNERWGEPLGDLIGRVLAEDLTQRLVGATVFTEAGTISAESDATVEVDVQRLDATPDRTVTLLAEVAVRGKVGGIPAVQPRSVRLTAPVTGPGTANLVATMSLLTGRLADTIATMLRTVPSATGGS